MFDLAEILFRVILAAEVLAFKAPIAPDNTMAAAALRLILLRTLGNIWSLRGGSAREISSSSNNNNHSSNNNNNDDDYNNNNNKHNKNNTANNNTNKKKNNKNGNNHVRLFKADVD